MKAGVKPITQGRRKTQKYYAKHTGTPVRRPKKKKLCNVKWKGCSGELDFIRTLSNKGGKIFKYATLFENHVCLLTAGASQPAHIGARFACSRVLLERMKRVSNSREIPRILWNPKVPYTAYTTAHQLSLSWATSIQSMAPQLTSWRPILTLPAHLIYFSVFQVVSFPQKICTGAQKCYLRRCREGAEIRGQYRQLRAKRKGRGKLYSIFNLGVR